jgi:putative thioredoxin
MMRQDGVMQQPRDFSIYGAVDLGARQAAAQRREQAAQGAQPGAAGTAGSFVIDVTEETFNSQVVERSRTVPVIVDLWAQWCGPCKQLSPVLEKLAAEAGGRWVLAKVDVDANPQLSRALQVQSIPMVVAVIGGQLVDGFLGALPEAQVRQWLSQIMAAAEQLGVHPAQAAREAAADGRAGAGAGGPGGPGAAGAAAANPVYADAQQAMERGDMDAAAEAFRKILAQSPSDQIAKVGLARVELLRRVNSYDEPRARREAAERPGDVAAQCRVADIELAEGRAGEAFDRLLGVISRTSGQERDQARQHLVGLFDIFPPKDPEVSRARARLSTLLF